MTEETWTITASPDQWLAVNAYAGWSWDGGTERFGVLLADTSLLPEEVASEAFVDRRGRVGLRGFARPVVEHDQGWQHLASELDRMQTTNRSPDAVFEGHTLEITFSMHVLPPRAGGRRLTPFVALPVSLIRILSQQEQANGQEAQPA